MAKPPIFKFPKSFGACADRLAVLKAERLAQQKLAEALKVEEVELTSYIINNLPKSEGGAIGKTHKVQVVTKVVPRVEDWNEFYTYIAKKKRFDLLQRRPSDDAIQELWDAKQRVPGVTEFQAVTVRLTKC